LPAYDTGCDLAIEAVKLRTPASEGERDLIYGAKLSGGRRTRNGFARLNYCGMLVQVGSPTLMGGNQGDNGP
jgi:hypothetical protein